jgi:micrococcal nuclease
MIFLDFGGDYRRDFTIMVSPPVAERLSEAGLAVDEFEGRRIRVRGVIEESGGPAIRLNDPSEIEVLDDGDVRGSKG